jgi:hypothetical protein
MAAYDFSHSAPHAVAHYCPAQRFSDAEAKTALRQFVGAKENSEVGTRAPFPGPVDRVKFSAPNKPHIARKIPHRSQWSGFGGVFRSTLA